MIDEQPGTGLPASIEMAWGLRERPVKGPRPGLSLPRIVEAGVLIAQSEGIGAVSMSKVAEHLGTKTMSLYRYVGAKEELLALMADTAMGQPPRLDGDWRTRLARWAWAQHSIYREHPWVVQLPMAAPATPNQIAWLEGGLAALAGTRLSESAKLSVVLLLGGFVRNEASLVSEINTAFLATGSDPTEALNGYGRLLAKLAAPERFPALRAALDAGVFDRADTPHEEFEFGLERVLDGVDSLVRRSTPAPGAH